MLNNVFKGNMTQLQALPISMKFLLQVASDIRNKKQKPLPRFSFNFFVC